MSARWDELAWPDVADAVARRPFALLPFGAIEEHGPHLPLGTDVLAAAGLSSRIAEAADLLELPVMPYGQVWSLAHFPGSLSIPDEVIEALVLGVAEGLERVGVRGLVLLSAHLGNAAALKKATRALEERGGVPAIALTYPGLSEVGPAVRDSPQSHPSIMHADELETSILLALAPEVVRRERAVSEYPQYPAHFEVGAVRWHGLTESGVFGDATSATPEKGRIVVDHVVAAAARIITEWKAALP